VYHTISLFILTYCANNFLATKAEDIKNEKEKKLSDLDNQIRELDDEVNDYLKFKENKAVFINERDHWMRKRDE